MKKSLLLLVTAITTCNLTFAQKNNFEGKVVFDISFPGMELDASTAAMLPKESTIYIKGDKSRTEMSMGMGMSNATISDGKSKSATVLMDIMGSKYAIKMTEADMKKSQGDTKAKVKLLDETKEIAGYKCKKAEITLDNKEKTVATVYYTPEIGGKELNWSKNEFGDIDGFLMDFETVQNGMTMKMTAKKVSPEKIDDSKFIIPADYKPTTQEELQKMFGGGR